jgi:hypothetical protein
MKDQSRQTTTAILARLTALSLMLVLPAAAQEANYEAPRLIGTGSPDLNGIWQALNSAHWDLEPHAAEAAAFPELVGAIGAVPAGQGVIQGGRIPYQDWAAEQKQLNFEQRYTRATDRVANETTGDPEAKCYLPGVPRATYMPFPFRMVQTPSQILIAYEYANATRVVHMDREPPSPSTSWMGWSIGHWEGDTLVIEVTDQMGRTWLDRAGNFHSEDMRVVERYTPISRNHLMYEATIEDPDVFTEPWTIRMPLYRRIEPDVQIMEFKCVEFAEEFMYGHLTGASN